MNELKIFNNEEFGQVRTVTIDGEPWFVGKDVAAALGYEDTVNALKKHVDSEDKIMGCQNATPSITDSMGRIQYPTWINESGMYALIFGSKLESAKRFKHWVTSEVLPALRKTGHYEMSPPNPMPKAQSVSEVVNLGKFVKELVRDQGATPYQTADILLDTMKQFGVDLSDKLLLPVKLDKVGEKELDAVEFKYAFPESTWDDYMMYRTLLKVSK